MSQTYQATGINLKGVPFGERDRLLTILTPEYGLIKAVAGGARKHHSSLRGRSELFVVNQLLLVKGRSSLYRLTQAETVYTYSKLSQNLGKLAISQYLAEIVLCFALSEQPQPELFTLLREHLDRIETCPVSPAQGGETLAQALFPLLNQGMFHLLSLAGIAPQVYNCCLTQRPLTVDRNDPNWRVGFSCQAGGIVGQGQEPVNQFLNGAELTLLQQFSQPRLPSDFSGEVIHLQAIEKLLRNYTEYHFHHAIRSASLVESLLSSQTRPSDAITSAIT
ncbi:MAG: DNA repair protein RecO [Halothece sp.]